MTDGAAPNWKPSWRNRRYGKYRSRGQNFRAWFFADSFGRSVLSELRRVKREMGRL